MVFATDQGIVHEDKVLLSRFRPSPRKKEALYYRQWFEEHGYNIKELPDGHFLEGNGEISFWNDKIFMGTGYRSTKETAPYLQIYFDREVILLEIIDPAFYHLDVGFFPLNDETIFSYLPAYAQETQKKLAKTVPNLIELTKEEAEGFCANSVTTDHYVIMQQGNPLFADKLHTLGYQTIEVDLSEFQKSGGGAHCLTNILEEEA
jgi:N-dimethylarginine dimethylaminohydrolase